MCIRDSSGVGGFLLFGTSAGYGIFAIFEADARLSLIHIFGGSAMEAIARQPEAAGDSRMNMIIIAALVEGVALIAIIVCLLTLFL